MALSITNSFMHEERIRFFEVKPDLLSSFCGKKSKKAQNRREA
jgi:hypothetical protein